MRMGRKEKIKGVSRVGESEKRDKLLSMGREDKSKIKA